MNECCDIAMLTALACEIAKELDDADLALLGANLTFLADALLAILTKREVCKEKCMKNN